MPERPDFEPLRDRALRVILAKAFKAFPKKVDELMAAQGWAGFRDFMAAVARYGEAAVQYKSPMARVIEKRGVRAELRRLLDESNTEAMMVLLWQAFYGAPGEEPEPERVREALERVGIRAWLDLASDVLEGALLLYAHLTRGSTPLYSAQPASLLLYQVARSGRRNLDPERIDPRLVRAFALSSWMHVEALLDSFVSAETTLEDLDLAVADPTRLTAFLQASPSNLHKGLVFGNPGSPSLSGPSRAYAEELAAGGIPVISSREEYREAFHRWGVPNIMLRPGSENPVAAFHSGHPDIATVFVDDSRGGAPMAVYLPEKSGGGPEMAGSFPENPAAVMYFKDLDWPENRVGNLVAVSKFEWQDAGKAVIEGWRGPGLESEDFAKNRLELFACADMQVDGSGYWRCARRW